MSNIHVIRKTDTKSVDNVSMQSGSIGDLIVPSTATDFPDANGASSVDGVIIDLWDRSLLSPLSSIPVAIVTSAEEVPVRIGHKKEYLIELDKAAPGFRKAQKVSLGVNSTPSHLDRFVITKKISDTQYQISSATNTIHNPSSLIGQEMWGTTRFSGSATLGFISLVLGDGVSGATVRAALIVTTDPSSGYDYATRLSRNEVVWSRLYPLGANVNIDFGGLVVQANDFSFFPPPKQLAPATGYEPRLMLTLYWESGTPAVFSFSSTITFQTETVIETIYDVSR